MAEILTESFCERCGTRYTFEAAIPKKRRIGRLKVLSKGLKNYVLSEDASLDEALAEARSEEERELSGGQLDAFHQTFQFCMSCRQYTCANCWNEAEGRCLSCAPLELIGTSLRSPLDDLLAGGGMAPLAPLAPLTTAEELPTMTAPVEASGTANGHAALDTPATIGSAWPTIDLFRTSDEQAAAATPAAVEPTEASEPVAAVDAPAAGAVSDAPPIDEAVAAAPAGPELATDFWTRPFTGFAPEPTNGHHAEPEPASAAEAAVEPIAEAEPVPAAEVIADPIAEAAAVEAVEVAAEPGDVVEAAVAEPEAPLEAAVEPIGIDEPSATVEAELGAEPAEPIAAELPDAEPVAAAEAPDPEAEARAAELAERTSRLLGRFRVQPRSAATTATEQAAAADAATAAAAAREIAAAATAAAPAAVEPTVVVDPEREQPAGPVESPAPAQPSWMFVAPAPEPEPVAQPALPDWPEPMVWGEWKSRAIFAGTLEVPASAQPSVEHEHESEPEPEPSQLPMRPRRR